MRKFNDEKKLDFIGSVLDHAEELPTLRRMKDTIGTVQEKILRRAPSIDILDELEKLEKDAQKLKVKIWENHLKGCLLQAITTNDRATAEDTVNHLAQYLGEREGASN